MDNSLNYTVNILGTRSDSIHVGVSQEILALRWGVDDVNRIFSQSKGCATLSQFPGFNPDRSDPTVRYGNFYPYPKRDGLAIVSAFGDTEAGNLSWAEFSSDELRRTETLVDSWQKEFKVTLSPRQIPPLAAPEVQTHMKRKGLTNPVDQVHELNGRLRGQIRERAVKPLAMT